MKHSKLRTAFLTLWGLGLVLFGVTIILGLPLAVSAVPGGILDHQAAGTAAEVDRIQHEWRLAALWNRAALAMMSDLVFIGIYGIGSVLGGLYFFRSGRGAVRLIGGAVLLAGGIFLATDYIETISQFSQLMRFEGDDAKAALAATVRPVKVAAWIATFAGILAALAIRRFQRRAS
ncbi:hypothetical protein GRI43_03170 [Altererythrobacter luteolus]|uniref:Uncharacterized protein n=1 Tax=Pontixanthobacter luteolus TaxID=295089 RepID=A0A6I4V202_9SPHN|nr:hypothetical protein [Pontixanthobacter luteolus]MXP46394.1 hypothetical protein [Pontixanthobacter luteolus]